MRKIKINFKNLDRIDNGIIELKSELHVAARVRFNERDNATEAAVIAKKKLNLFLYGAIQSEISDIIHSNDFNTRERLHNLSNEIGEILEHE